MIETRPTDKFNRKCRQRILALSLFRRRSIRRMNLLPLNDVLYKGLQSTKTLY